MANVLGSAVVRLGLDAAEFTSGMSKAEYQLNQLSLKNIALGSAIGIKLAEGITFAAKALWDLTMGSVDAKAKLQDLSVQTGMTVETLSGLARVGKYSGTSLEEITGASNRMTRALAGASEKTSGAGRALKGLGINFAEFKALAPDEQLVTAAKAMAGFKDGTDKSAAAMLLFGRSGAPFLKFLKELGERGILVTKETTASALAAKEYEDNVVTLGLAMDDFKALLGESMLPTLLEVTQSLIDGKNAFGSWAKAIWEMSTWNPFRPFKDAENDLPAARENLASLRGELEKLQSSNFVLFKDEKIKEKTEEIADAAKMVDYLVERRKSSQQTKDALKLGVGPTTTKLDSGTEVFERNAAITENATLRGLTGQKTLNVAGETEASRYLESLRKQIIATQDLTAAEKVRRTVREGMEGLTPSMTKEILGKAAELDSLRIKEDQKKMVEDLVKGQAALAQIEQEASDAAASDWAKRLSDGAEALKQMDKSNAALQEEIMLIGKSATERAAAQAVKITREEIAPKEQALQNLEGVSGDKAADRRGQLQEEIDRLKNQIAIILKKADTEEARDIKTNIDQMTKSNSLLEEEISLLGKDARARAVVNAARIQKEEVVPLEKKLAGLEDTTGDQADAERKRLQEQIVKLKAQQALVLKKADVEVAQDLKMGNKTLQEEIDLLGLDAKARYEYNSILIDTVIATKQLEAATQDESEAGKAKRKALEEEIGLLREKQQLEGKKFAKQEQVDFKTQGESASKAMSESLAEGILDGFRQGSSYADVFIKELKAQFAKTILSPIIQPIVEAGNDFMKELLKGIVSGVGSGGTWGNQSSTSPGGFGPEGRASGGAVAANTLYRVNEKRTESLKMNGEQFLLMGNKGGTIDSMPSQGGGGVTVIQNNQFGSNISRNELANAAKAAHAAAKADILRSVRLGGSFSGGG